MRSGVAALEFRFMERQRFEPHALEGQLQLRCVRLACAGHAFVSIPFAEVARLRPPTIDQFVCTYHRVMISPIPSDYGAKPLHPLPLQVTPAEAVIEQRRAAVVLR